MNQGFHVRFACHQGESDEEKVLVSIMCHIVVFGRSYNAGICIRRERDSDAIDVGRLRRKVKEVAILHASRQLHKKTWKWRLTQRRMNVLQIIGVLMNVVSKVASWRRAIRR